MMFTSADNSADHDANMGNSYPTKAELEDPEVNAYLSVYDYAIPVLAILIVLINFSVVLSSGLLIKKGVEPRFTYLFLGNVALTDMVIGLSVLFGQYYPKKHRNHQICAVQLGMIVSSTISSIYSVGLLAVDRFLYIVYGIKYSKLISINRVRLVIALTWIIGLTLGFLPLMGWSGDTLDGRFCWFVVITPDPLILLTVSIGIVPIILVIILYSIILYHALANIKRIKYSIYSINTISEKIDSVENLRMFKGHTELPLRIRTARRKASHSQIPHKWKAVKVVLFTTFAFISTWAPYFIASIVWVAQNCDFEKPTDFCKTLQLLIASPLTILGFLNSLINPLIYAWWHNGFRSYVRKRIKRCFRYHHETVQILSIQAAPPEGGVTAGMCSASASHGAARSPERRPRRRRLSHGVTSLMYAAQQGDVDRVRHLLRSQAHCALDQDRTGKTALHYCCTSDSNRAAQVADLVVMAAPDLVETRDEDGFTPLHLAVIAGNTQLVTFLLANAADVRAVDNEQHTVVHWATVCGETTALRAVLAAGAPVSTPDVHGGYPLHYAAQMCGGDKDSQLGLQVLHALLGHKDIVVSVEDGDKRQPLLWAASAGSAKALLALVRAGAIVESSDRDGLTALHCAASRGHTDCIDTLLTLCGASPDVIDSNGCTALHYAVTLGHADATALLLAHGADPNRQDRKGRSPAHCGCAKGQFETVKLIGARGAKLWMRNARGDFPLHEAAASGRRELVSWLLSMRPSQVNARNNDGRTPLHMAALNDNVDMCKILLDSAASINPILRTSKNVFMTPLDCALQRGFRSTAKYLQLHGGVPATRLGGPNPDNTQVSSSLSLQIRDDVTFWGDSSSDSDQEKTRSARKAQKRKITFRNRKKASESESDFAKAQATKSEKIPGTSAKRTTTNTATNTSASVLGDSPRKVSSSRLDYSNEIIINGKTEINIHHTKEITVETESAQVSPRKVEIDSTEKINVPASGKATASDKEKRPKSAKFSKLNKETAESSELTKTESVLGHSTGTSDDTMDTVIDTYKQKADEIRQSSREKVIELPDASNTSEEVDGPQEIVVEASIHPEPKKVTLPEETKEDTPQIKGILKTTESFLDKEKEMTDRPDSVTVLQQLKVDADNKTILQEERKVDIVTDGTTVITESVIETENIVQTEIAQTPKDGAVKTVTVEEIGEQTKADAAQKATEPDTHPTKETIDSLTKAAVVKKDEAITPEADAKTGEKPKKLKAPAESEESIEEVTVKDKKTPVSKVVGKPRDKTKADKDDADSKRVSPKEDAKPKKESKIKKRSEQPAIVRVLKEGEKIADDDGLDSSSSEVLSDSLEQASKTHKSFKVLSEKEAKELQSKAKSKREDKKPRSKSDDTKFKKDEQRKLKGSKIPTPTFQTPLSKSERQLDRLLDHESRNEARIPSLPNIHETSRERFFRDQPRPDSHLSAPVLPSVYSDNERDSASDLEDDARQSPTKKKKVKKRPKTRRRESRSAGSDYESSNLIDSGFEPSPRSSRIPKWKNMSDRGVNMTSVTRSIQSNIRRYHLERKIFQHLLDLKRSQIRAGQHNEAILVKRAIDQYNQSCASTVGAGRYIPEDFSFKSFEKFLYDSLRKLQKIDLAYLRGLPDASEHINPLLCTQSTHRCMHATHAYTGIPCAAYLPKMDHHNIPKIGYPNSTACKPGTAGFLPNINPKKAVTLELSHGTDKQVISLPTDKLDQNKRYYVTFTVKGHEGASSEENVNGNGHIHAKSD